MRLNKGFEDYYISEELGLPSSSPDLEKNDAQTLADAVREASPNTPKSRPRNIDVSGTVAKE